MGGKPRVNPFAGLPIREAEYRRVELEKLAPAEYNPRRIGARELAGLEAGLRKFGLVQPIVWNERSGTICGGHQRLKILASAGVRETTVAVVDLGPADEKALCVQLNSKEVSGEFTSDLEALLASIQPELGDGFGALNLDALLKTEPDRSEPGVVDPPANPVARRGDVWLLGEHVLVCGDSTSSADVALGFARVELPPWIMVTDPPYGVEYDPQWRNNSPNAQLRGKATRKGVKLANDDRADWLDAYQLFPGDVAYVWHGQLEVDVVKRNLEDCRFDCRTHIIWRKNGLVVSRGHYHSQHESCWYAVRQGATARWTGGHKQTSVWDIDRVRKLDKHGTEKPIACMMRPLENHGEAGDVVYDPFVGSGTTVLAAERMGRRCVAMEIAPGYIDVVVERWQNETGGKAKRAQRGKG